MKIVQLTPGTGNFYCGNCLRDNALAHALRAMGHEVVMVPLYLPHVVDEADASTGTPIFYGGISVYLEQKLALFRHTPAWLDRLLSSGPLLRWAADRAGMTGARDLGAMTVSMLQGEEGQQNKELRRLIEWLRPQGPFDVVCLSNALLMGLARRLRAELEAPVVCTLSGEDAFLDALVEPYRSRAWRTLSERAQEVDGFIAVSRYYGEVMRGRLSLESGRVHVVYNGINLEGYGPAERAPEPATIGFLARLCEAKGLGTLVDAFIELRGRERIPGLRLRMAGAMTPQDRGYVEGLKRRLAEAGLEDSVEILPNVDHAEKQAYLRTISVLSVPATYGESFGLYVLEALASGVPVVQPRHGAFEELIEELGGGVLCEPDDPRALADALEVVLLRYDESRRSAEGARRRVLERFGVDRMAADVAAVFEGVVAGFGEGTERAASGAEGARRAVGS